MTLIEAVRYRWRALVGRGVGVSAGIVAYVTGLLPGAASLVGWNVGLCAYLVPTLVILFRSDAAYVRRQAGRTDEGLPVIMTVILAAVIASLAAIVYALHEGGKPGDGRHHSVWLLGVCVSTLMLGWIAVQALFAQHYAHRYFGDRDDDGTADRGLAFHGDPPQTYRDFVYVAICMGATCQVSDFDVTHSKFRNLVSAHAAIAFLFNTMVLALGINIFASLMGQ